MTHRIFLLFLSCLFLSQAHAQLDGTATYYADKFQGRTTASGEPYDKYKFTAAHVNLELGTWVIVTNLENGKRVQVRVNDRMPQNNKGRIIDLSRVAAEQIGLVQAGVARVQLQVIQNSNSGGVAYTPSITPRSRQTQENYAQPLPTDVPVVDLAGNPLNDRAKVLQPDDAPISTTTPPRPNSQAAASALPKSFKPGLFRMLAFEEEARGFGVQVGAFNDIYRVLEVMNDLSGKGYQNTLIHSGVKNNQPIFRILVGPYLSRSEADRMRKKLRTARFDGLVVELGGLR
ncbi:MAG: septal ring lytic transglycosylase RlpA family protein [Bacteroidota bacterium]